MARTNSPPHTHNRLGALIRARREEQKVKRMRLAADAGIHVVTLTNIELGIHDPSIWALARMVDMLKLDPAEVIAALDRRQ